MEEPAHDHPGIVRRVDLDKRPNGREVGLRTPRSRKRSSREKALLDLVVADDLSRL
jgi:hypothetical protein